MRFQKSPNILLNALIFAWITTAGLTQTTAFQPGFENNQTELLAMPEANWINGAILRPKTNPMANSDWCVAEADYDVFVPGLFGGLLQFDCLAVNPKNWQVAPGNTPGEQGGITGQGSLEAKCVVTAKNVAFTLHGIEYLNAQHNESTPFLLDSTYLYHSNKPSWLVEALDVDRAKGMSLQNRPGHYRLKVRGYAENHQKVSLKMRILIVREALPGGPPQSFETLDEKQIPSKQTVLHTFSGEFTGTPRWNPSRLHNYFNIAIHLQKQKKGKWVHHAGPIFSHCDID